MLSDDSSSESDSGRFKSKPTNDRVNNSKAKCSHTQRGSELLPDLIKSRNNYRYGNRKHERKDESRHDRRSSKDRFQSSRHQSPLRRRYSQDRRQIVERPKLSRDSEHYSRSRDIREKESRKQEHKEDKKIRKKSTSPNHSYASKRTFQEEIKRNISNKSGNKEGKQSENRDRGTRDVLRECSVSKVRHTSEVSQGDKRAKKEVQEAEKKQYKITPDKSNTGEKVIRMKPEENQHSNQLQMHFTDKKQLTSYYNLTPAKAYPQVEESVPSIIDSSEDEEKLRAKLLNLEKKLEKTKKKKSKKSKKKSKSKHEDRDEQVEVSSTTDFQEKEVERKEDAKLEVSSTVRTRKDSSEEGEICSDDEDSNVPIDPSDLRHRLKRHTAAVPDMPGSLDPHHSMKVAGPSLPPHLANRGKSCLSDVEVCGPQLPPHMTKSRSIGPTLPSNDMRKVLAEASESQANMEYASSEDDAIGPLPAGSEIKWTEAHKKLEERALHMKIRDLDGDSSQVDVKHREEWMLELPEAKAKHIGLGPRQFRAKEGPDMSDRTSWTDSPQTKALKAAGVVPMEEASTSSIQQEAYQKYLTDRDKDQEKAVKKHKKKHKREESLLEIHEKKMKKKKKKEKEEGSTRRPFSRDMDLQVNRFDDAQKRSIIKKAQELDSRFSSGKAKFL